VFLTETRVTKLVFYALALADIRGVEIFKQRSNIVGWKWLNQM